MNILIQEPVMDDFAPWFERRYKTFASGNNCVSKILIQIFGKSKKKNQTKKQTNILFYYDIKVFIYERLI